MCTYIYGEVRGISSVNFIEAIKYIYDYFDIREDGLRNHTTFIHGITKHCVSDSVSANLAVVYYESSYITQMWNGRMKLSEEDATLMIDKWEYKRLKRYLESNLVEAREPDLFNTLSQLGYQGDSDPEDMATFCVNMLHESIKERIPVTVGTNTNVLLQRLDRILEELRDLPAPTPIEVPEEETEEEMVYIGELYRAYSEEEGSNINRDNIQEYEDYSEDLKDRRIQYFAAESVRRGLDELYVENLENQFDVLKEETLKGVRNTWRKPYPSGYQRMLSVMETAVTMQVTNYILGNVPNWISNDIRQGVCHFLVKEGKLYWVRKRRTE